MPIHTVLIFITNYWLHQLLLITPINKLYGYVSFLSQQRIVVFQFQLQKALIDFLYISLVELFHLFMVFIQGVLFIFQISINIYFLLQLLSQNCNNSLVSKDISLFDIKHDFVLFQKWRYLEVESLEACLHPKTILFDTVVNVVPYILGIGHFNLILYHHQTVYYVTSLLLELLYQSYCIVPLLLCQLLIVMQIFYNVCQVLQRQYRQLDNEGQFLHTMLLFIIFMLIFRPEGKCFAHDALKFMSQVSDRQHSFSRQINLQIETLNFNERQLIELVIVRNHNLRLWWIQIHFI